METKMMGYINKIREIIRGLFNFKSNHTDDPNFWNSQSKKVFHVGVGKSFKGHAMGLTTHTFNNSKIISLYNQYYMGSVNCNYYTDSDTTTVEIIKSENVPKYISEKIKDDEVIERRSLSNGEISVTITSFNIMTRSTRRYDGIYFSNHFENINELRTLNEFTKQIKNRFRNGTQKI